MNLCEIGLFHIVLVFLHLPVIIIIRFSENNVLCLKYMSIYEFQGGWGNEHIPPPFVFYYLKKHKEYKRMTYTKIKFYIILILKKIPRINNKNFTKRGAQGAPLLFIYELSIVVLVLQAYF